MNLQECAISQPKIILASSSVYRKQLLQRLQLEFEAISPDIDEQPHVNESTVELVIRLAKEKANKVARGQPSALIIASDQVLLCGDELLGKPGKFSNAKRQLLSLSGNSVTFYTSLCVLNSKTGRQQVDALPIHVHFRTLSEDEIERYLTTEQPYDCAGSFKSEAFGISLISGIDCDDPSALIGLPLIRLCEMLRDEGIQLP